MKGIYEHRHLIAAVATLLIACSILIVGFGTELYNRWSHTEEFEAPELKVRQ